MKAIADNDLKKSNVFNGIRVLLAEDSKINQQIALELLDQVGAIVDVANNGQDAIDMLGKKSFDVVLMDLQMPVLDGYQAVAIIRQNPHYNDLPIIAMTADASVGDRDKCLSIGMNDHVVKSLDPKYLYASILKCVKLSAVKPASPLKKVSDFSDGLNNIDTPLDGIDLSVALKSVSGNGRLLKKLLQEFVKDHAGDLGRIKESLGEGDIQKARRLTHTLQGISGSLGFQGVLPIVVALENALKNEDLFFCDDLIEALDAPINQVLDSIESFFKDVILQADVAIGDARLDKKASLSLVDDVAQLIDEMSPDSEMKAVEILQFMDGGEEKALAHLLVEQLAEFDFHEAEKTLNKLTNAIVAL